MHLQGICLGALLRSLLPVTAVIISVRKGAVHSPCAHTRPLWIHPSHVALHEHRVEQLLGSCADMQAKAAIRVTISEPLAFSFASHGTCCH